MFRNII